MDFLITSWYEACLAEYSFDVSTLAFFPSQAHIADWTHWVSHISPYDAPLPASFHHQLTPIQRLLVLRAIAPHKTIAGMESYVRSRLGPEYVSPPPVSIVDLYRRMSPQVPAVLLLSQGRDPSDEVTRFAEVMGIRAGKSSAGTTGSRASIAAVLGRGASLSSDAALPQLAQISTRDRFHVLSLGQGQGDKAESVIFAAATRGDWVLLQNCHLATGWLPTLSRIITTLGEKPIRDVEVRAVYCLRRFSVAQPQFRTSPFAGGGCSDAVSPWTQEGR